MEHRKVITAAAREERETVPLVLTASIGQALRKVAAVRNAQGKRNGNRSYSMSAIAREALAEHLAGWQSEIRKAAVRGQE